MISIAENSNEDRYMTLEGFYKIGNVVYNEKNCNLYTNSINEYNIMRYSPSVDEPSFAEFCSLYPPNIQEWLRFNLTIRLLQQEDKPPAPEN